jgi:hypothetical protein
MTARLLEQTRVPQVEVFKRSDDWEEWSRPSGHLARALENLGGYTASYKHPGLDWYVEPAKVRLRSVGSAVRQFEANPLSTEELFSRLHSLDSLSESRSLTETELQQASEIQRELDERESSEPGPAAALAKIDADLERIDKISEILRLLSALEE